MRQLVGVFSELEASSAHPMPRPFKLEAYVDPAEPTGRSAATLMKVVCLGCGIAGGGLAPRLSSPLPVADAASALQAPGVVQPVRAKSIAGGAPTPMVASMPDRRAGPLLLELGDLAPVEAPEPSARADRLDAVLSPAARFTASLSPGIGAEAREDSGTPIAPPSPATVSRQTASSEMGAQRSAPVALAPDDTVPVAAASFDGGRADEDVERPASLGFGAVDPEIGSPSVERNGTPTQTERGVEFSVPTRFNGVTAGRISLLLEGSTLGHPDRVSDNISVRLGDIIALLGPRMDPVLLDRLGSSEHAERYLTLNDLRANGILVSFDAKDRLVFKAM